MREQPFLIVTVGHFYGIHNYTKTIKILMDYLTIHNVDNET